VAATVLQGSDPSVAGAKEHHLLVEEGAPDRLVPDVGCEGGHVPAIQREAGGRFFGVVDFDRGGVHGDFSWKKSS
jgi:hypothetical protein